MRVVDVVATTLADRGVVRAFGVVGSGNFHVTNALRTAGVEFVATRHECGATTMADAHARISRTVTVVTLHQGCGLTNAMTGLAEAAKSRTPLVVLAAEATNPHSNFFVDQDALATSVGAVAMRLDDPADAATTAAAAFDTARDERRTVVLNLPLPVQDLPVPTDGGEAPARVAPTPPEPTSDHVAALVDELARATRPVFVAGRGARDAGPQVAALAADAGALLATSAVANGLFHDDPWALGISGGFSSPTAAELIRDADLVVGWGCTLNMWTMRHGRLLGPGARVVQVDLEVDALGSQRSIDLGVVGDVGAVATAVRQALEGRPRADAGYRDDQTRARLDAGVRWRDHDLVDTSTTDRIDPHVLTIALDDLLPAERVVGVDSGNFMGHPSVDLSVPDEDGFCFTQAFQSIGLGLATTIGAALARPDRLAVAALGDGGGLMGVAELETVVRLGLDMVVVVYNDDAYGAEVHHFGPDGHDLATVEFPDTDVAAIGRGFGFEAVTVRSVEHLDAVAEWVAGPRDRPLLVDAKVVAEPSWWLEEAFRGH
ncbi:thiamine pyrophosphate-binding protein [Salsipaludibacter albus]|uniref:thiamine pyrophosphate-binding protein n=1 Tax=Salsipaludibacter albus TaxID=2849650 RepID=UPI0030840D6C